jgi:enoyl-CoA hydratase
MSTSQSDLLRVEQDGAILRVTLNRPEKLNAINRELHDALASLWSSSRPPRDASVVVLTGAGRAFSAGGDVSEFATMEQSGAERREMARDAQAIVLGMLRYPLPIIAAVNGPAVGLGCTLALLSDAVVMSEDAFLADTHVQHGLVPGDGGFVWPLLSGMLQVRLPLMLGDRIPASEAYRLGLATQACPASSLTETADGIAHRLASMPQAAVQDTKRMLNLYIERSITGVMDFAMAAERLNFADAGGRGASPGAQDSGADS